tara:strand:- start:2505 stop:4052 length:1548 start_codon:yes stop_codon:yes gene_type:complete
MARLRQQNPQNYVASGNINAEFENVIRYLNSAELGEKTLGELLKVLFSEDGVFQGPIEFRNDSSAGIQYRVGSYTDTTTGWTTLATLDSLRGAAGSDLGTVGAPIIHTRQDTVATSGQTVVNYAHDSTDELLVYVNGILKRSGGSNDYVSNATANTVTFNSGLTAGHVVTIYKIRATAITGFTRSDTVTTASQTVFPFVHDDATVLQVYKNGVLQREGGSNDYVTNAASDTVTFTSAVPSGNTISIITVENTSANTITGLMTETNFTDTATGKIPFSKLQIADADIAQAKVAGLVSHISTAAKLTVSGTTPSNPSAGDLFLDTSVSPNVLRFYDGTQFLQTSPESGLPTFSTSNAGQVVQVNGTGTALVYAAIDLSSRIATTQRGAANGVASLDSTGRLPSSQLPTSISSGSFYKIVSGSVSNGAQVIQRIFKQRIQIDAIHVVCSSGTGTVQIQVNGVNVGSTVNVSSSDNNTTLSTPQEIDATSANKKIGFNITNASSLNDLEVTFAFSILSS